MVAASMGELLVESWVGQPGKLDVDREKRTVRGLVLLGEHSKNGYDYDRAAMKDAVARKLYEGVVLVDQHRGKDRALAEKFAVVREAGYVEGEDGVARIVATDTRVFDNELGDTFLDVCEFAPASAGLSHEARGEMAA